MTKTEDALTLEVPSGLTDQGCANQFIGPMLIEETNLESYIRTIESLGGLKEAISVSRGTRVADDLPPNMDPTPTKSGAVGVLDVRGPISREPHSLMGIFGGASTLILEQQLATLMADDSVGSIVMRINSPGGSASGVGDLADAIRSARETKPVIAYVESHAFSAAYWIASQADHIVASRHAMAGSIGVIMEILDDTEALERIGVQRHIIKKGKHKADMRPPITDEKKKTMQATVDGIYDLFVEGVALGRGVSQEEALAMADASIHIGRAALKRGFVDSLGTAEDAFRLALSSQPKGKGGKPAAAQVSTYHLNDTHAHSDGTSTNLDGHLPSTTTIIYTEPPLKGAQGRQKAAKENDTLTNTTDMDLEAETNLEIDTDEQSGDPGAKVRDGEHGSQAEATVKATGTQDMGAGIDKITSLVSKLEKNITARLDGLETRIGVFEEAERTQTQAAVTNKREEILDRYNLEEGDLDAFTTMESLVAHEQVLGRLNARPLPPRHGKGPDAKDAIPDAYASVKSKREVTA